MVKTQSGVIKCYVEKVNSTEIEYTCRRTPPANYGFLKVFSGFFCEDFHVFGLFVGQPTLALSPSINK